MSIGNFSRFVLEAPDASTSQRVVFPEKVIELAPLCSMKISGEVIYPLTREAPDRSILAFYCTVSFPSKFVLAAPLRSTLNTWEVKFPVAFILQAPLNLIFSKDEHTISAV